MNSPGGKKTWVGGHSTKFASVQIWPRSLSAQKWIRLFQNRRWLLVSLRNGQAMLGLPGGASELNLRIDTLRHISIFKHLEMTELCKVLNVVHALEVKRGDVVIVAAAGDYSKPRPAVIVQTDAFPENQRRSWSAR